MLKPPQEVHLINSNATNVSDVTSGESGKICQAPVEGSNVTDVTTQIAEDCILLSAENVAEAFVEPHVPASDRPSWKVYDDFTRLDNSKVMRPGTYHMDIIEKDEEIILIDRWVCSPLHIDAQTRDDKGNNFGRLLRFKDSVGHWKIWAMPMELLRGSGEELRGTLLAMGVLISPESFRLLTNYLLQTVPPKNQLHCSTQTGWHDRHAYVLPDQVIGPNADRVVFQSSQAAHEEFRVAGSLDGWRENVASKAIGNPMLMLGLSCAFVGPLLALTHSEGGGIHMVGDSSSGKSTIARAASSVWGGKEYRRSWRTTSNGVESAAALFNDGFLVLDEISECDPKDVGEIAYSLGNGYGKQRANRYGSARPVTRWLCFALSNGERTLATAVSEGGGRVKAGQSMRLLDLPTKRIHGVWDNLHEFSHGASLSEYISSEAATNYGYAGRAYLERLAVSGGAGTGKTSLAVEKAKGLGRLGKTTLLLCFNAPLSAYLRQMLRNDLNVEVHNFHQFCLKSITNAGIKIPKENQPDFWEELPYLLLDALQDSKSKKYDAIIIDEGQDFRREWLEAALAALKDSKAGTFYLFYDDNQRLYPATADLSNLADNSIRLFENVRNSRPIFQAARAFYAGGDLESLGPDGLAVEWEAVSAEARDRSLEKILNKLVNNEGVAQSEIAILTAKSYESYQPIIGRYKCCRADDLAANAVILDSIYRFKGLEKEVVILIDLNAATDKTALLYVGFSRARSLLLVLDTPETIKHLKTQTAA